MNIKQFPFSITQYIQEENPKKQIYLHHTAGGPSGERVYQDWAANFERIATCVTISGQGVGAIDGQIVQGFSSKYWAYHLGLKESTFHRFTVPYKSLDRISIGVEICNWGQLTVKNGRYYTYVNKEVNIKDVIKLPKPYKGFDFFHNYTDAQIASVKELLLLWSDKYTIPLTYSPDIWDITPRALKGEPGVYTHNSVRTDKVDVYPHPKLIDMLKSLK